MREYPKLKELVRNVSYINEETKKLILTRVRVDEGIRELCDAINNIDEFVTICSSRGNDSQNSHSFDCPITYVDFYSIGFRFDIAEMLLLHLVRKFGTRIECRTHFEERSYIDVNDKFIRTGEVSYRYRIVCVKGYDRDLISELIAAVREFKAVYLT